MLLICLANSFAQMCCFKLYLLDVCQIDGNITFKNEFRNWTKRMARQAVSGLQWHCQTACPEPPWLLHVGSHVW